MIPILYDSYDSDFTTNGLGRLADAARCEVVEELNGEYVLEMDYPITGIHYRDIKHERVIYAVPADGKKAQPFEVYRISTPINGMVTVYAYHVSYRLKYQTVKPFTASGIQSVMASIRPNVVGGSEFNFSTNMTLQDKFSLTIPKTVRDLLNGNDYSILDAFKEGEYEFEDMSVRLLQRRGAVKPITLRFGKNIVSMEHNADLSEAYTGILPFWKGFADENASKETLVLGDVIQTGHVGEFKSPRIMPLDLSDRIESYPTKAEVNSGGQSYISVYKPWEMDKNIEIDFVALWQTEEYKDVAALERADLGDTISVVVPQSLISDTIRVVRTVYDVLMDRYSKIELGNPKKTLEWLFHIPYREAIQRTRDEIGRIRERLASITPGGGSGGGGMININGPYYPVYSVIDKDITLTFPGIFWEKDDPIVGHVEGVYNGTAEIIANYAPKAGQYYYWRYSKVPEGDGDLVIASDGLYSSGRIDEIKANGDSFWGEDTMKLKYFPKKYPTYTWVNASAPNDGGVFGVWAYYRKPDPDMTAREFSAYLAGKTVTFHLDYFFVFDGPLPGDGIEYFDRLFDHPYDLNLIEMNHSYVLDHENRINEVETGLSNVQDQIKNATVIRNENVQQYDYHSITQNLFNTESSYNRSYYAGGELTGEYIFDLRFDTIPDGYADKIKFIRFDPVGDPTYCGIRYEDGTTYLQIEAWFQNSNKRLVVWAEKSSGLAATFLNTVFNGFHVIYSTEKAETSVTERLASLIAELQTKGLID